MSVTVLIETVDPSVPPPNVARLIRIRAGLTQGQLARALGVARTTIVHWENGRAVPSELLGYRYAALLHQLAAEASA